MNNPTTNTTRQDTIEAIWSMHKDVNGIRPRWMHLSEKTNNELDCIYDALLVEMDEIFIEDKARESRAVNQFEIKLAKLISSGADTRTTAIRWLRESEDFMDSGHMAYEFGLPHGYLQ